MIHVVGGTYQEHCFEPYWKETFGSGLRAVFAMLSSDKTLPITYHTLCDSTTALYLQSLKGNFITLRLKVKTIPRTVEFSYDHPLITPIISPRPDTLLQQSKTLTVKGEDVLAYGLIEGKFVVKGDRVLYDPQSPAAPITFSQTKSKAKQLVVVINHREAQKITGSADLKVIRSFFFNKERVNGLIVKMGAKGAVVYDGAKSFSIPVYKTESVWPIGSGDVFSAMVFYKWTTGSSLKDAANFASRATAIYCNTKGFDFGVEHHGISQFMIRSIPKKRIYLAGPFFTFSQRWLVNQVREALLGFGINVFSPWHDVGYGSARDVVDRDIEGIHDCGLVFAIVDGLDSGTLFEIGYAVSKGKPVLAFVQNETKDSIKMLEGTNCVIVDDLATAIYKTYWMLAEHE